MKPLHALLPIVLLLVGSSGLLVSSPATAQSARIELHPLQTTTLTDKEFLTGLGEGKADLIVGELRIPKPGAERLPVVVLIHGSGGIGANIDLWSQELQSIGVATFIVDSFTGRGITSVVYDQEQLDSLAMIVDAYRALELLAKHPRIDPSRIGLMGFSRGGRVALYASLRRFQRMHSAPGVEFAIYLPFYPTCNVHYSEDEAHSNKPLRLFHGAADDWVLIGPCRDYVSALHAKGVDIRLTEYEGAYHAFDIPLLANKTFLSNAQTTRNCVLREAAVGEIVNARTGQRFTFLDPCVERGATIGYDPAATAAAIAEVKEVLTTTFRLK